jgi:PAS domain S-box-containing protein
VHQRTAELSHSQRALEENRRKLHMALSLARMGSFEYDLATGTVEGDEQAARLLGLEPEAFTLPYDGMLRFVHPDDRRRMAESIAHGIAAGEAVETEGRIQLHDGQVRILALRGGPELGIDGQPVRMTGVCWDVSEARRIQQELWQAERLAAIGQAATVLSHESRNAIQNCLIALQMLRRLVDEPKQLGYVQSALKSLDRLRRAYDDIREYAGPLKLERTKVPLDTVWREAWTDLAGRLLERDVRLVEEREGTDLTCAVDTARLGQVFRNLIENSWTPAPTPSNSGSPIRTPGSKRGRPCAWRSATTAPGPPPPRSRPPKARHPPQPPPPTRKTADCPRFRNFQAPQPQPRRSFNGSPPKNKESPCAGGTHRGVGIGREG